MATRARAPRRGRGYGWLAAALFAALGSFPALAVGGAIVVAPAQSADPALAPLARGIALHLQQALQRTGAETLPTQPVSGASAEARARSLAVAQGAALVIEPTLSAAEGGVTLRLVARDADGAVVEASVESGSVAQVGSLTQRALISLLGRLQRPSAPLAAEAPPGLGTLAAFGRAADALEREVPVEAWHAVQDQPGPTAEALRGRLEALSRSEDVPLAERSRLASAAGRATVGWLHLREALREGDDPNVLLAAGDAARARGDQERALRLYERAAEQLPESAAAAEGRAFALEAAGKAEAGAAYRRALALAPDDPALTERLARFDSVSAEERAELLLRAARLRAARFEVELATRLFEEVAGTPGPRAAEALRELGLLEGQLGHGDRALAALARARAQGDEDAEGWVAVGTVQERRGDLTQAASAYRHALALDAELASAQAGLGRVLARSGDSEQARAHLERALALSPDDTRTRQTLARLQRAAGDGAAALLTLEASAGATASAELLREQAAIRAERGELGEARAALEEAVALAPDEPEYHAALADLYAASGEAALAEEQRRLGARLGARNLAPTGEAADLPSAAPDHSGPFQELLASFPPAHPQTGAPIANLAYLGLETELSAKQRVLRWFQPRTLDLARIDGFLRAALAQRFSVAAEPPFAADLDVPVAALRRFSKDRGHIAFVNDVLGVDGSFAVRLTPLPAEAGAGFALRARLFGGRQGDQVFILANEATLTDPDAFRAWNPRPLLPLLALLALFGHWFARGWATLVVTLDYDAKGARGFFDIVLSRHSVRVKLEKGKPGKQKRRSRIFSRLSRSMADKETRFRFVPARSWHVAVHGLLQDHASKEVIGSYLEEQVIRLERGRAHEVHFDFRPSGAPIEVRVQRAEGEPPQQVRVGLLGDPQSVHYVRGDQTALHAAGDGTHVVVLADGDRVYTQEITIRELGGTSLAFATFRPEEALFAGCPAAVEAFLLGDRLRTADALEQAGQIETAQLMRGEHYRAVGNAGEAARCFEAAGRLQEAAELSSEADDSAHSATLFEQAGDFGKAAERYREAGDFARAGEAFESAYDFEGAIDCYREAGDLAKVVELLERTGAYFDAGRSAHELGDVDRAIRNLQQVESRDADHGEACQLLSELFAERGEWDLAVAKLEERVAGAGGEDAPLELLDRLAFFLDHADRPDEALGMLERIRARDFQYAGVAERVESLRGRVAELATQRGTATVVAEAPSTPGRYEIVREVGRGGMGVVYEARDMRLDRIVALKRLPENLRENPTAVRLFQREAKAAAALNHPNIVTLFDTDQEDGNYYITMEFMDGLPLDAILRKKGRLSVKDALRIAIQAAQGLQYAHERRIVHRDIKTSNLFFTRDRVVKIMDFGLAKMIEEVRRAATVIAGTPYYMAPEQAAGDAVDHRADLYAFGITLFELLTGHVPFAKGDVTYHHRHTAPPDPRTLASELPAPLAELILHLIAKEPDDRPATTAELVSRLKTIARAARS